MKISVITAVRNGSETLRDCIESVKNQTLPKEHIVIDGASTDGTLEIVAEYRSFIAKFVSEPDNGIYDAMNKGISLATGDVIGTLNADDFYVDNEVLQRVAKVFTGNNTDSCYGDLLYVDSADTNCITRLWRSGSFNERRFFWGWMPPHPTFFVRRSVYEKYGLFSLNLGSAADYELMIRFLLKHKITTAYIPKILVKMRTRGTSNASFKNRIRANRMDRLAWEVNGLRPYPWTLWMKPLRKVGQFFLK